MTTTSRNVGFRQTPIPEHRLGRFKVGATALVQGAPVTAVGQTQDATDLRLPVIAAAEASAPVPGLTGILWQEQPWENYIGRDAVLDRPSDMHTVAAGSQAQVIHGTEVKFLVQNTEDESFEGQRDYDGRIMFKTADVAALAVGNMVTPGAGNDTDGWWKKTTDAALSWGRVVEVDNDYGLVVFQLSF